MIPWTFAALMVVGVLASVVLIFWDLIAERWQQRALWRALRRNPEQWRPAPLEKEGEL